MITKFADHKRAQCAVDICDNGDKVLWSYETAVAGVVDNWLYVRGLYSATTRKHIGWFAKSLGLSYQTLKNLYMNNLIMNLETGEVMDWA